MPWFPLLAPMPRRRWGKCYWTSFWRSGFAGSDVNVFDFSAAAPAKAAAQLAASLPQADYEQWTDVTYYHAPRKEMRARFWQHASEAAKARMTAHLQSLPPTMARVRQAREMGWIPSL